MYVPLWIACSAVVEKGWVVGGCFDGVRKVSKCRLEGFKGEAKGKW